MRCNEFEQQLDDLLDNRLSAVEVSQMQAHARECAACEQTLRSEQQLHEALQNLDAPPLGDDRADAILASVHARHQRHLRAAPWVGGAIAASLALGLALGLNLSGSEPDPSDTLADNASVEENPFAQAPVLEESVQTVRLAFESDRAMEGVTLTLEMPPNAELDNFPGQQQLSWTVDLDAGQNVLALPMRVLYPDDGEIVARLQHGEQQSTFRAPLPQVSGNDTSEESAL